MALQQLFPGLYATNSAPLPFMAGVVVRSFILQTTTGVVIIYNSPGIDEAAQEIATLGTPTRLLLNHYHEAIYGQPKLDVAVYIHEWDRPGVEATMQLAGDFKHPQVLGTDLELIPSYAHTVGTTFFLWNSGEHRFLFHGDSLWIEDGIWKAVILPESDRRMFLNTLTLLRGIDFDVLVPWHAPRGAAPFDVITPEQKLAHLDALIERITAGASGPRA